MELGMLTFQSTSIEQRSEIAGWPLVRRSLENGNVMKMWPHDLGSVWRGGGGEVYKRGTELTTKQNTTKCDIRFQHTSHICSWNIRLSFSISSAI